ncbi:MAG: DNA internalization-related competence protein ComEC/Rec2 [Anaerovoracaceae bacterium]
MRVRRPLVFLTGIYVSLIFILLGIICPIFNIENDSLVKQSGSDVTLVGMVTDLQKKDNNYFSLVLKSNNSSKVLVNCYFDIKKYRELPGREVSVSGKLEVPKENTNPRTFNYRMYLKTRNISTIMTAKNLEVRELMSKYEYYTSQFRFNLNDSLYSKMTDVAAGITMAMLIGDNKGLDGEVYETFQRDGIAHILAISGLHMVVIYNFIAFFLKNKRNIKSNMLILVFLFVYSSLANFSPSVVRSSLMIGIHIISKLIHRRYDLLTAAAVSIIIILTINPWQLFNLGFQMSYLAIFIMASFLPKFSNYKISPFVRDTIMPIIVIQIGMAPFTIYHFNFFSFTGLIANIPCIFISSLIIPVGIVAMGFEFMAGFVPEILISILEILVNALIKCNDLIYLDGAITFDIVSPYIFFVFAFYSIYFFLSSEYCSILYLRSIHKKIRETLCKLIIISLVLTLIFANDMRDVNVYFIDVGQGSSVLFKGKNGRTLLIDGGGKKNYDMGKKTLMPYLLKNGVKKIDLGIVTHLDTDHYDGIASLARLKKVDKLGFYDGNEMQSPELSKTTSLTKENFLFLSKGNLVKVDENLYFTVISPTKKEKIEYKEEIDSGDENRRSLVLNVVCDGVSFLITGDMDFAVEETLIDGLKADVLQVGHHGSAYSTGDAFLKKVKPDIGVIQVGKNNYGHPSKDVINRLLENNAAVYRTDTKGGVGFVCKNGKYTIKTVL